MRIVGALVGVLVGLAVVPASAWKVGFVYGDGSDAIFSGQMAQREMFEATISEELQRAGAKGSDSDIADLKGLAHPVLVEGKPRTDYICGWVKGIGEATGGVFLPFYYLRTGPVATIVRADDSIGRADLKDIGCAIQVPGLDAPK